MAVVGIPKISVIIPVFDRAQMVADAVESTLAQEGVEVEVVVVDDGSTDGTAHVIDGLASSDARVRAMHQPNAGPSAARNVGVAASSHPLITFLDSDDLMAPDRLARQVAALDRTPGAEIVIAKESLLIADGVEVPRVIAQRGVPISVPMWNVMTMLLTRSLWDRIGGFDESMRMGEDTELYARIRAEGHAVAKLDEPVIVRRITGDNLINHLGNDNVMLSIVRRHRPGRPKT